MDQVCDPPSFFLFARYTQYKLTMVCIIEQTNQSIDTLGEYNARKRIGWKRCNCSCFEVDQEIDAILLIIGIVYGVCRIVIKSVQQCTYFLFSVNLLLVGVNHY
jgi:hypothetical protein